MKCPYCGSQEQRVLDSRPARDEEAIRRRRECVACNRRFTTFEEPEKPRLILIKRGGGREEFSREKVLQGMIVACRKRPVPLDELRLATERVERELFDLCEMEVRVQEVGDRVERELAALDPVAYVRFASVYREFDDPIEFRNIVNQVQRVRKKNELPGGKIPVPSSSN